MPPASTGDLPKEFLDEISKLDEMFTIETSKLKEITAHFVSELEKGTGTESYDGSLCLHSVGLTVEGGSIVSFGSDRWKIAGDNGY